MSTKKLQDNFWDEDDLNQLGYGNLWDATVEHQAWARSAFVEKELERLYEWRKRNNNNSNRARDKRRKKVKITKENEPVLLSLIGNKSVMEIIRETRISREDILDYVINKTNLGSLSASRLKELKFSIREIAKILNKEASSVSRELRK